MVQIGIPLFFYISGFANSFYDHRKGFCLYLKKKTLRLLVPFILAIFLILIPRFYIGQAYEPEFWVDVDGVKQPEWNFFKFYPQALGWVPGNLSWLWFLMALYINSIVNYPLMAWTQRRVRGNPFDRAIDLQFASGILMAMVIWAIPNALIPVAGLPNLLP